MRQTVGEIVEVQGGHIVRSTGRKDRHSKVCTAKGPRDRRVRLSAPTAIQFYDVQDRLGYDRPSKAVDWLIKKAKASIDELEQLPAWNPTAVVATKVSRKNNARQKSDAKDFQLSIENPDVDVIGGSSSGNMTNTTNVTNTTDAEATTMAMALGNDVPSIEQQQQLQYLAKNHNNSSSFLPPSLDSDAIADTIKSFFPMGAATEAPVVTSSPIQFQSYPPDLLSRTSSQNQDLRLTLQSFPQPIFLQHQQQHHVQNEQQILSETAANHHLGYDGSSSAGWSEHHQNHPAEISRFQRLIAWNSAAASGAADTGNGGASGGGGGFIFNTLLPQMVPQPSLPLLQPLFGQNQFFSQRGPLQSSNMPSIRAWIDPATSIDQHHFYHSQISQLHQQSAISAPGYGGFAGFQIPTRIQGEQEEHDGTHNKPSSASSDSRR